MKSMRWQDTANVILGLWMLVSPALLGMVPAEASVMFSGMLLGCGVIFFSGMAMHMSKPWEELVDVILGLALIAAPWIFGFADIAVARGNSIVVGALVAGIALWGMWTDVAVYKWMDEHNLLQ